jgi:copper chaperone CopZ
MVTLALTRMHCGSCAALIEESLSDQPGVTGAVVGFESAEAPGDLRSRDDYDPRALRFGRRRRLRGVASQGAKCHLGNGNGSCRRPGWQSDAQGPSRTWWARSPAVQGDGGRVGTTRGCQLAPRETATEATRTGKAALAQRTVPECPKLTPRCRGGRTTTPTAGRDTETRAATRSSGARFAARKPTRCPRATAPASKRAQASPPAMCASRDDRENGNRSASRRLEMASRASAQVRSAFVLRMRKGFSRSIERVMTRSRTGWGHRLPEF